MISDPQEKSWGMACHLAALAGFATGVGFILGPLIVWLVKKDQYPFVDDQGKESLNFQISLLIYHLGAGILAATIILIPVALVVLAAIWVANLILIITASVAANNGQYFRYPFAIRFLH